MIYARVRFAAGFLVKELFDYATARSLSSASFEDKISSDKIPAATSSDESI
jgi:hypothetical protein